MLDAAGRDRVEEAVRRAEEGTAGEIVVVLARQAGSYKTEPLAYGLLAGLLSPWPLLFLTTLSAPRIFTLQAALVALVVAVATWLGPRAVPASLKRMRARAAAFREFTSRGMADTRGRTGILLFVAGTERYAEVVGDRAITDRVADEEWQAVIEALVAGMREGRADAAVVAAVERIGAILARHVPPEAGAGDELPNRVIVI